MKANNIEWASFIGIPFAQGGRSLERDKGLDCWGLICLVYDKVFGIQLEQFTPRHSEFEILTEYKDEWEEIKCEYAQPGDLILIRILGLPLHVGCYVSNGKMLHSRQGGIGSVIEGYLSPRWRNKIMGYYRYAGNCKKS